MGKLNWDPTAINPFTGNAFEDEDPENLARLEEMSFQAAIQLSLETSQERNKRDKPTDLPKRKFKTEEIEEDEKKRDRELYGPPTPPRRQRQIDSMGTNEGSSANATPTAGGTNNPSSRKGAAKKPQEAATADDHNASSQPGIFIPKAIVDKLPRNVRSAVADAVIYHRQLVTAQAARDIVGVMMKYNKHDDHHDDHHDDDAGNSARPETSPAPRGNGLVPSLAGQGFAGAAARNPNKREPNHREPNHAERMAIIRAALNDPNSSLSIAMQEEGRFIRGAEAQQAPTPP
ncbi:hypothetical protein KVR01_012880 [Diaporthe batatas]|uniref:uncharacterized protein n=1 Tax=Diaporthe batatas TaxID=748121 RepID=UPI001D058FEF|nr:uncharacterized protein KVR01_012880 [Diaporthe batatas]KAG8157172.1 hypothetical protein KVR01_012880 [Diaporthe batatas]